MRKYTGLQFSDTREIRAIGSPGSQIINLILAAVENTDIKILGFTEGSATSLRTGKLERALLKRHGFQTRGTVKK